MFLCRMLFHIFEVYYFGVYTGSSHRTLACCQADILGNTEDREQNTPIHYYTNELRITRDVVRLVCIEHSYLYDAAGCAWC